MSSNEHPAIQNEDWRLQAITTLTRDFSSSSGIVHKAGTPIMAIATVKYGTGTLAFGLPNMTALFLDLANTLWMESQHSLDEEHFSASFSEHIPGGTVQPKDLMDLFEFLERRMGSIVFAFSALEAFANEHIPVDYLYKIERSDKRCIEVYNKEQIENRLSLDVKLGDILPGIMKVKPPKGGSMWSGYKRLKTLRDRIIHCKSKDRSSSGAEDNTIWGDLLKRNSRNVAIQARDIVGYYLTNEDGKPRWYLRFPASE